MVKMNGYLVSLEKTRQGFEVMLEGEFVGMVGILTGRFLPKHDRKFTRTELAVINAAIIAWRRG